MDLAKVIFTPVLCGKDLVLNHGIFVMITVCYSNMCRVPNPYLHFILLIGFFSYLKYTNYITVCAFLDVYRPQFAQTPNTSGWEIWYGFLNIYTLVFTTLSVDGSLTWHFSSAWGGKHQTDLPLGQMDQMKKGMGQNDFSTNDEWFNLSSAQNRCLLMIYRGWSSSAMGI